MAASGSVHREIQKYQQIFNAIDYRRTCLVSNASGTLMCSTDTHSVQRPRQTFSKQLLQTKPRAEDSRNTLLLCVRARLNTALPWKTATSYELRAPARRNSPVATPPHVRRKASRSAFAHACAALSRGKLWTHAISKSRGRLCVLLSYTTFPEPRRSPSV